VRRFLGISSALHALLLAGLVLSGSLAARTPRYPPVYRINLVAAPRAEVVRPRRERPRPKRTEAEKKPETAPKPEPKILEPEKEEVPEKPAKPAEPEKPKPEPEREGPESEPAPEEPKPEPVTPEEGGNDALVDLKVEGRPFPFPGYLERLVQKLYRSFRPTTREQLHALVYFEVERTGKVSGIDLEEPSGNFLFDQSAVRAVSDASPMPPLPDGYTGDYLGVHFDFNTDFEQRNQ
jgi:protein TonB